MSEIKEILRECELKDVLAVFVGLPLILLMFVTIIYGVYLLVS